MTLTTWTLFRVMLCTETNMEPQYSPLLLLSNTSLKLITHEIDRVATFRLLHGSSSRVTAPGNYGEANRRSIGRTRVGCSSCKIPHLALKEPSTLGLWSARVRALLGVSQLTLSLNWTAFECNSKSESSSKGQLEKLAKCSEAWGSP